MADACPVLTPEERKASDIVCKAQDAMMETVHAAVAEAVARVREHFLERYPIRLGHMRRSLRRRDSYDTRLSRSV